MTISQEHLAELRGALAHLHDLAYLEAHPVTARIDYVAQAPDESKGQLLRRALRLAIEALDPGAGVAPNAPAARPYQVLRGRYIARQSIVEVAQQLDIGERQAYRELRRGVAEVARLLWPDQAAGESAGVAAQRPASSQAVSVRSEVERLSVGQDQIVDLSRLLSYAVECVQPLARAHGVSVVCRQNASDLHTSTNRIMLRQAILNLLSHAVSCCHSGEVALCLDRAGARGLARSGGHAVIALDAFDSARAAPSPTGEPLAVATELLDSLDLAWELDRRASGTCRMTIRVPLAERHMVLIIDDNRGLIRLLERYLAGQPYLVCGETDPAQAVSRLEHLQPDIVILDVMMPERDGWETLQALRRTEAGRRARVVVCSIIRDPGLSSALGADAFLHKPVDRARLLHVLSRLVAEGSSET